MFTALAGGGKMDPGQEKCGCLPLNRKEILCGFIAGIFCAQVLHEPFRLPEVCSLLQQGGWGCPLIPTCAKGGSFSVCLRMCGHQE